MGLFKHFFNHIFSSNFASKVTSLIGELDTISNSVFFGVLAANKKIDQFCGYTTQTKDRLVNLSFMRKVLKIIWPFQLTLLGFLAFL